MFLTQTCAVIQQQRQRWKSNWVASCLPRAEAALKKHRDVLDAIDRVERIDDYKRAMDAATAAFVPELRGAIEAFYSGTGKPLVTWPTEAIERYDARLVGCVTALAKLDTEGAVAVILAVRLGADVDLPL